MASTPTGPIQPRRLSRLGADVPRAHLEASQVQAKSFHHLHDLRCPYIIVGDVIDFESAGLAVAQQERVFVPHGDSSGRFRYCHSRSRR